MPRLLLACVYAQAGRMDRFSLLTKDPPKSRRLAIAPAGAKVQP